MHTYTDAHTVILTRSQMKRNKEKNEREREVAESLVVLNRESCKSYMPFSSPYDGVRLNRSTKFHLTVGPFEGRGKRKKKKYK